MVRGTSGGYGPFGGLRVERETKPDGRYILYFSWDDGHRDAQKGADPPARPAPWSPESGPLDDDEADATARRDDEPARTGRRDDDVRGPARRRDV